MLPTKASPSTKKLKKETTYLLGDFYGEQLAYIERLGSQLTNIGQVSDLLDTPSSCFDIETKKDEVQDSSQKSTIIIKNFHKILQKNIMANRELGHEESTTKKFSQKSELENNQFVIEEYSKCLESELASINQSEQRNRPRQKGHLALSSQDQSVHSLPPPFKIIGNKNNQEKQITEKQQQQLNIGQASQTIVDLSSSNSVISRIKKQFIQIPQNMIEKNQEKKVKNLKQDCIKNVDTLKKQIEKFEKVENVENQQKDQLQDIQIKTNKYYEQLHIECRNKISRIEGITEEEEEVVFKGIKLAAMYKNQPQNETQFQYLLKQKLKRIDVVYLKLQKRIQKEQNQAQMIEKKLSTGQVQRIGLQQQNNFQQIKLIQQQKPDLKVFQLSDSSFDICEQASNQHLVIEKNPAGTLETYPVKSQLISKIGQFDNLLSDNKESSKLKKGKKEDKFNDVNTFENQLDQKNLIKINDNKKVEEQISKQKGINNIPQDFLIQTHPLQTGMNKHELILKDQESKNQSSQEIDQQFALEKDLSQKYALLQLPSQNQKKKTKLNKKQSKISQNTLNCCDLITKSAKEQINVEKYDNNQDQIAENTNELSVQSCQSIPNSKTKKDNLYNPKLKQSMPNEIIELDQVTQPQEIPQSYLYKAQVSKLQKFIQDNQSYLKSSHVTMHFQSFEKDLNLEGLTHRERHQIKTSSKLANPLVIDIFELYMSEGVLPGPGHPVFQKYALNNNQSISQQQSMQDKQQENYEQNELESGGDYDDFSDEGEDQEEFMTSSEHQFTKEQIEEPFTQARILRHQYTRTNKKLENSNVSKQENPKGEKKEIAPKYFTESQTNVIGFLQLVLQRMVEGHEFTADSLKEILNIKCAQQKQIVEDLYSYKLQLLQRIIQGKLISENVLAKDHLDLGIMAQYCNMVQTHLLETDRKELVQKQGFKEFFRMIIRNLRENRADLSSKAQRILFVYALYHQEIIQKLIKLGGINKDSKIKDYVQTFSNNNTRLYYSKVQEFEITPLLENEVSKAFAGLGVYRYKGKGVPTIVNDERFALSREEKIMMNIYFSYSCYSMPLSFMASNVKKKGDNALISMYSPICMVRQYWSNVFISDKFREEYIQYNQSRYSHYKERYVSECQKRAINMGWYLDEQGGLKKTLEMNTTRTFKSQKGVGQRMPWSLERKRIHTKELNDFGDSEIVWKMQRFKETQLQNNPSMMISDLFETQL